MLLCFNLQFIYYKQQCKNAWKKIALHINTKQIFISKGMVTVYNRDALTNIIYLKIK